MIATLKRLADQADRLRASGDTEAADLAHQVIMAELRARLELARRRL